MNIHLAPIDQTMQDCYLNNRIAMEFLVRADRTLKNEVCPIHNKPDASVTVFISKNEPLRIEDNLCCEEFRKHVYSICDIPTVINTVNKV